MTERVSSVWPVMSVPVTACSQGHRGRVFPRGRGRVGVVWGGPLGGVPCTSTTTAPAPPVPPWPRAPATSGTCRGLAGQEEGGVAGHEGQSNRAWRAWCIPAPIPLPHPTFPSAPRLHFPHQGRSRGGCVGPDGWPGQGSVLSSTGR